MPRATLQLPGRGLRLVRPLTLRAVEGPVAGQAWGPLRPPLRLGSAPGNDVVLSDLSVSRHHAILEEGRDGLVLRDAGSTNGVLLGGHRILSAVIEEAVRITLGETVLDLCIEEAEPELLSEVGGRFPEVVAESPVMKSFLRDLARVAPTPVPVLIEGETGTGKELSARALHREGTGAESPFVVVDCGATNPNLVESALFGHRKGAFTGAEQDRAGAFQAAHGGTLFLDEIGELPLDLQPKLLRALEASTVTPLGSDAPVRFTVRVVAATHRDLRRMVNERQFREDLYFRLAVCPLRIPPLRERGEDVARLAEAFFQESLSLLGEPLDAVPSLDPEARRWLTRQAFPGNVRELRNIVQRAVLLGAPEDNARGRLHPVLSRAREGEVGPNESGARPTLEDAKRRFERGYLLELLRRHGGHREAAAEEAGIHPKSLQRLVRRHALRDEL